MLPLLYDIVNLVVNVLVFLIIARAVLSWIPEVKWRYRQITEPIEMITEPLMQPFRRIVPPSKTGGIDISPVLAIIALEIARRIIISLVAG